MKIFFNINYVFIYLCCLLVFCLSYASPWHCWQKKFGHDRASDCFQLTYTACTHSEFQASTWECQLNLSHKVRNIFFGMVLGILSSLAILSMKWLFITCNLAWHRIYCTSTSWLLRHLCDMPFFRSCEPQLNFPLLWAGQVAAPLYLYISSGEFGCCFNIFTFGYSWCYVILFNR